MHCMHVRITCRTHDRYFVDKTCTGAGGHKLQEKRRAGNEYSDDVAATGMDIDWNTCIVLVVYVSKRTHGVPGDVNLVAAEVECGCTVASLGSAASRYIISTKPCTTGRSDITPYHHRLSGPV